MCSSLIEIGSKTAEKNSAQTNTQTDRQTDTTKIMVTWPWTNYCTTSLYVEFLCRCLIFMQGGPLSAVIQTGSSLFLNSTAGLLMEGALLCLHQISDTTTSFLFPSLLWRRWLGGRNVIQPIKCNSTNAQTFWSGRGGGGPERERLTQVYLDKWLLNGSSSVMVPCCRYLCWIRQCL